MQKRPTPLLAFLLDLENFHSQISTINYRFNNGTSENAKIDLARDTRILRTAYESLRNRATDLGYMTVNYHRGIVKDRVNEIRTCLREATISAKPYSRRKK